MKTKQLNALLIEFAQTTDEEGESVALAKVVAGIEDRFRLPNGFAAPDIFDWVAKYANMIALHEPELCIPLRDFAAVLQKLKNHLARAEARKLLAAE